MSVRMGKMEDIPEMLGIYAPFVEETAVSFEYTVPTVEEFKNRFLAVTRQFPWLVWEEEGAVLGYAYACAPFERAAFSWCAEPSVYLAPEARGRGIGRKLYEALEKCLKDQGYCVLYAVITASNAPSIAFHKALGYRHLADFPSCGFKQNAWHGVVWMEKRLQFVEMPTHMPEAFDTVVKTYQK